jgi:IS1 family transposase
VNRLDSKRRQQVIAALVEGCSVRATCRMTGAAKGTVLRLIADLGAACDEYQDQALRSLPCKRVQCDEIWSFCYAKEKNVPGRMKGMPGVGSVWTWTAIDADSKLAITWFVGDRSQDSAMKFMLDVASRMEGRIQLTTDALKSYRYATTLAFDGDIDYAQLVKIYAGQPGTDAAGKYSQPECIGTKVEVRHGNPDLDHVSTSYVERANLTMRMGMRRFTRLTNGFSKKIENHEHAIALHFMHYNFCRKHESLKKMTPAMAAGITDHVWTLAELVALLPDRPAAAWGSLKKQEASADEPNSN